MRRNRMYKLCAAVFLLAAGCFGAREKSAGIENYESVQRTARIDPDYAGTVIPPNIAPLNFSVQEPGAEYRIEIRSTQGAAIVVASSMPQIEIPSTSWKKLLAANRGEKVYFDIYIREHEEQWRRFAPLVSEIAAEGIDPYLAYRLLKPLYNKYVNIGIYQRNLETYDETAILENRNADRACINCHTFVKNQPDPMVIQTRSRHGLTMLLARDGKVTTVDTRTPFNSSPAAYTSWHPGGRHMVFSVNKVSLFFHTDPLQETRDVFDAGSDLALYTVASNTLTTTAAISDPGRAENWPEWSPDGRYLYFSSATVLPIERFKEVRYDLMRLSWDVESGAWGKLETVLSAAETGLSITQPKVSPDGRFLVCTMAAYGNFPVFLASSDLYMVDLESGHYRRLDINSEQADSWHAWSSNGRWLVFSSKRRDGLFAKPYFSYVDAEGRVHKPVLMPQRDPQFYDSFIKTYNVPVFITGPVRARQRDLAKAIYEPSNPLTAELDPRVQVRERDDSSSAPEPYLPGIVQ